MIMLNGEGHSERCLSFKRREGSAHFSGVMMSLPIHYSIIPKAIP